MRQEEYLRMKTDDFPSVNQQIINHDLNELKDAFSKFTTDAIKLGGLAFGTAFFQWLASLAAIYLLILDRTNWKTNILTGSLVPYIFFSLPLVVFAFFRGQFGMWVAFITVVLRLFFPRQFPDWLELPGAIILIIVVAPDWIADTLRDNIVGAGVCLAIGCYLLQEHIRASGGFRNSFTRANGISNSCGIVLLLVYPVWYLIVYFL